MTPAEKIKLIRSYLSLTQKQFGKILGVSDGTICRWEKASRQIPKSAFIILNMKCPELLKNITRREEQNDNY